jgi:hypothetical protein
MDYAEAEAVACLSDSGYDDGTEMLVHPVVYLGLRPM